MTRLVTEWLDTDSEKMGCYGALAESLTGVPPLALAACAAAMMPANGPRGEAANASAGMPRGNPRAETCDTALPDLGGIRAAVVRVTSGLGVIGGFADSICALLSWLGAEAFMPQQTDIDGIYHAAAAGAELIFVADDDRFICMNMRNGAVVENDKATAYGYAQALDLMAGGIRGEAVLLLGFGPVGRHALRALRGLGASVTVYDKDSARLAGAESEPAAVCGKGDIARHRLILDATNEGGWLGADKLHPEALIAAAGLPRSRGGRARGVYKGRVFSDALQTGTLVMLCRALI
jgi:pyrrolysine biosynthesis protein PylD